MKGSGKIEDRGWMMENGKIANDGILEMGSEIRI
jgi:hypothetical protein